MRSITKGKDDAPFNRRFDRIIAADSLEELSGQLQGAVSLIKTSGARIDFHGLARDLYWFPPNPDRVKREWAGGFYMGEEAAA